MQLAQTMEDVFKIHKNRSSKLHKIYKNGGVLDTAFCRENTLAVRSGSYHFRGKYHGTGRGRGKNCGNVKIALDEIGFFL